jgi:rod shape-determining protein MreB
MKNQYNLKIGEVTAERIKIENGNIKKDKTKDKFVVKGLDTTNGLPRQLELSIAFFSEALNDVLGTIISAILGTLEMLPEELSADIIDRGIILTGGGSLLRGLDELILEKTNLPVSIADNPLFTVAIGTSEIMFDFKKYKNVFMKM